MKRKFTDFLKKIKSVKVLLFSTIVICVMLPVFVVRGVFLSSYESIQMTKLLIAVQEQCNILASDITANSYFDNTGSEIVNTEIDQITNTYSSRIVVINSDFVVIKDSYGFEAGNYLYSENIINAFNGKTNSEYFKDSGNTVITMPVYDTKGTNVIGVINVSISNSSVNTDTDYYDAVSAILILIFAILAILIASVLTVIITRPLKKIRKSIVEVSIDGKGGHIDGRSLYEYNEISESVNVMLDRINQLNMSRQEFVSNVSHELKTPMTSMKVLADSLVTQENVPVEIYRDFMNDIVNEIDRENQIITDLLTLVKMDQTKADLNIATVNINELVELVLKRLRPIAVKSNIELVFESFRPVAAEIDEVKFTLTINNLVENAIKYNTENGWVRVSLNADHKFFFLTVVDSGIGMSEDELGHIFERFYRVDKARSRKSGGTGLGLAITKSVVLMHKGTIKVYSKENEGTTFTVKIPLCFVMNGGNSDE